MPFDLNLIQINNSFQEYCLIAKLLVTAVLPGCCSLVMEIILMCICGFVLRHMIFSHVKLRAMLIACGIVR